VALGTNIFTPIPFLGKGDEWEKSPTEIWRQTVAEPTVNYQELEPLEKAVISYLESDTLFIQTTKPFIEGEEIAQGVTVFYDKDNENEVVGMMIDHAETLLKPFVDAILEKHGVSLGTGPAQSV
jgi:uncharacterized protein YuzE